MRKIIVLEHISLDGVIQAPGDCTIPAAFKSQHPGGMKYELDRMRYGRLRI